MSFAAALRLRGGRDSITRDIEWWTPPGFFKLVDREFAFDIDLCASSREAAKCKRFFTPEQDALKQEWRGSCWLNPPYTPSVRAWLDKAHESAQAGATVVCLLASRWDVRWWRENVLQHASEIRFLTRALRFQVPRTREVKTAAMPGVLVIYRRKQSNNIPPVVTFWDWRAEMEAASAEPSV